MKLRDLLDRVNLVDLLAELAGYDAIRGLNPERGGLIRDPRPGHAEGHASFSVYRRDGLWRWKRHGGDAMCGTAYDLLLAFGYPSAQAFDDLRRRAGLPTGPTGPLVRRAAHRRFSILEQALAVTRQFRPLDDAEQVRLANRMAPLFPRDAAWRDLNARGLDGAVPLLQVGKLRRDVLTHDGRLLGRVGGLVLPVTGPEGQVLAAKARNIGTPAQLTAAGLDRYVYVTPGHGAPAWCNPGYGTGTDVLIVEGELNAAAAWLGAQQQGLPLDVQGLAGAGSWPHLTGLGTRPAYVYVDGDAAGEACAARLVRLLREAGTAEIRRLPALPGGQDFCDLLGQLGAARFGTYLHGALSGATPPPQDEPGQSTPAPDRPPPSRVFWEPGQPGWETAGRSWPSVETDWVELTPGWAADGQEGW